MTMSAGIPGAQAIAAPPTPGLHHVYAPTELRNANLAADAVERSLDSQRERESYRPFTRAVRVVRTTPVTPDQARKFGFRVVTRNGRTVPLVLVETHLRDAKGVVWDNMYLYDGATHLLISDLERSGVQGAKNTPILPLSY
jgi:hypothetical protein